MLRHVKNLEIITSNDLDGLALFYTGLGAGVVLLSVAIALAIKEEKDKKTNDAILREIRKLKAELDSKS
jgi:hypothetical protein